MAEKMLRIAVASSDGIVVNSHFGRATAFHIYQTDENFENVRYLELRTANPVCDRGNHDEDRLNANLEKIADCDYLLVSRIGYEAEAMARQKNIESYEIPGIINESIGKLKSYVKLKELFA